MYFNNDLFQAQSLATYQNDQRNERMKMVRLHFIEPFASV